MVPPWIACLSVCIALPPPFFCPLQLHPLLNTYFIQFDGWFPLFGTISIAIFGLYLLLAAAKGNVKFGTRFFLIKVRPTVTADNLAPRSSRTFN